jgi:hypothetical protein
LHLLGSAAHVVHSVRPGRITLTHYFSCLGGPGAVSIKSALGHVTPNLYFCISGICGSRSATRCDQGAKHRRTIFILMWARCSFHKGCAITCYAEVVFLHPMGFAGHVAHSGASGARNGYALFFMLRWDRYRFYKKCNGTRYTKLLFFHPL